MTTTKPEPCRRRLAAKEATAGRITPGLELLPLVYEEAEVGPVAPWRPSKTLACWRSGQMQNV